MCGENHSNKTPRISKIWLILPTRFFKVYSNIGLYEIGLITEFKELSHLKEAMYD